jgi:hypothetical protein
MDFKQVAQKLIKRGEIHSKPHFTRHRTQLISCVSILLDTNISTKIL